MKSIGERYLHFIASDVLTMKNNTPFYILLLFVLIFFALIYIILHWILSSWTIPFYFPYLLRNTEGFANPKYTYKPKSASPNLYIAFGLSDLAIDVSAACGFIKVDSNLITIGNQTTTIDTTSTPTQTPTQTSTSDITPDTNQDMNSDTNPDMNSDTTPTETPTPTQTPSPIEPTDNDYTVPYTQLSIYKMYNAATGYSSTSNVNIYKMMDASYGKLFDNSHISEMTDETIDKLWNSMPANVIDNAIYTGTNYFVIQSEMSNRECTSGLSSYFLSQIKTNKTRPNILLSLKNAYYAIIKPRFLINTLSNIYWQNAQSITNSDKGTFNSIIFVLNTGASLATANTLEKDLSENNVAKIVAHDTPFTMDSLWLYQIASVGFELCRFVTYFEKNGSITSGSEKPAITTNATRFVSGFPKYLEKINQVTSNSPLVFLLKHLPNDSKCQTLSTLTQYINNIQ